MIHGTEINQQRQIYGCMHMSLFKEEKHCCILRTYSFAFDCSGQAEADVDGSRGKGPQMYQKETWSLGDTQRRCFMVPTSNFIRWVVLTEPHAEKPSMINLYG
jgi:hypothetical protein